MFLLRSGTSKGIFTVCLKQRSKVHWKGLYSNVPFEVHAWCIYKSTYFLLVHISTDFHEDVLFESLDFQGGMFYHCSTPCDPHRQMNQIKTATNKNMKWGKTCSLQPLCLPALYSEQNGYCRKHYLPFVFSKKKQTRNPKPCNHKP